MEPRIREQALPEKGDDRFFDRWAVDKAAELGARAVKRTGLEKLKEAIHTCAEGRSLRHAPAAERDNMDDRALVASMPERIEKAKADTEKFSAEAEEAARNVAQRDREIEDLDDRVAVLRPALRGGDGDIYLTALANAVVFAVDLFVIHVALGRIPGHEWEYWLTSGMMGAGAVLVGDVLGWIGGVGSIREDGSLRRPGGVTIGSGAGVMVLAVWFFVQLSKFRETGLKAFAEHEHVTLSHPTFFMTAQILFLIAAAISCFAYIARRSGRELSSELGDLEDERDKFRAEAKDLGNAMRRAELTAAEAPALRKAAEERILARDRIAAGDAAHDLKQGEYLENLIEPEYMRERADVEIGARAWGVEGWNGFEASLGLRLGIASAATIAAGALAFWVLQSVPAVVFTSLIVAVAFALWLIGRDDLDDASESGRRRHRSYVARLIAAARKGDDRATDIEDLVPFVPPSPESHSSANGNGNGAGNGKPKHKTRAELIAVMDTIRQALDG